MFDFSIKPQRTGHKICLVSFCKCDRKKLDIHLVCYDEEGQRRDAVFCAGFPLLLTDFNQKLACTDKC